jgi:hypothetical protein
MAARLVSGATHPRRHAPANALLDFSTTFPSRGWERRLQLVRWGRRGPLEDKEKVMPSKNTTGSRTGRRSPEALKLLKEDHAKVQSLFNQYEKLESDAEKQEVATTICNELKLHASMEEQIFYPAVRRAIEDQEVMNEADVEHAGAKELIAKIEKSNPADEHFDALVTVLGEAIKHHVKEEEGEMFKQIRKADLDLEALGDRMLQYKADHEA